MKISGSLSKMVAAHTAPISYSLVLGEQTVALNPYLGKKISLCFTGQIICTGCEKPINKSYQNGYCYPCTQRLASCDLCIIKPERCHFHLGSCREPAWGQTHCMIPHCVYLANTTGIKVGITRKSQIPTRWIDQGAIEAVPFFEVASRRISGLIEVALAKHVTDKSNWRQLLQGTLFEVDLMACRQQLLVEIQADLAELGQQFSPESVQLLDPVIHHFEYPVLEYPKKIISLGFDKTPHIEGTLLGIKGQYLIIDGGVINIRKHAGYVVECALAQASSLIA